jgi:hypothetical protein
MKIQLTIEVESKNALATILKVGSDYSLFDYQVLDFKILPKKTKENKP